MSELGLDERISSFAIISISGEVVFDVDRNQAIDPGETGIGGVAVVLRNESTGLGLAVLTDGTGNYTFNNVPDGDYRIVESYGIGGAVATPADFTTATVIAIPVGVDPPVGALSVTPPTGTNKLDSTTPNTLFVTTTGVNLTDQDFLDGPVIIIPIGTILDPCTTIVPGNLIVEVDGGTYGSFPAGTPLGSSPATAPYPTTVNGLTYQQSTGFVDPGYYTVINIMAYDRWWRIADVNTGDETGRFMEINGDVPGATIFQETVNVTPQRYYLFTAWICNVYKNLGGADPKLGVTILDQNNNVIYQQDLGNQIPINPDVPEWKQIGTLVESGSNTQLTVIFTSEGLEADGNDYAIDQIELQEVTLPVFTPTKSVTPSAINVGEIVTYTVTLTNTCNSPLTSVFLQDILPPELSFVAGTVTGGTDPVNDNPNPGFNVPDIAGGGTATITFQARGVSLPVTNPVNNTATMNYSYTPVQGGVPNPFSRISNVVPVQMSELADLSIVKTDNPDPVSAGSTLTYTLVVSNAGPSPARTTTLTDAVPAEVQNPEYSTDGGITWNTWTGTLALGDVAVGNETILIRGRIDQAEAAGTISNTASVSSPTPDPNPNNNTSTITTTIDIEADVAVVKTDNPDPVIAGNTLTYTIVVSNLGPSLAQTITLTDIVPASVQNPEYSTDGGITWTTWIGTLALGNMNAGINTTIEIRGKVNPAATGTISNTAIVSSPTPDPNPNNNTSTSTTDVNGSADLSVVKTDAPDPVVAGNTLTYTIVVSNAGPSVAQTVTLVDTVPAGVQNQEYSTDGGVAWSTWTGTLPLGNMNVGSNTTVEIRGKVNPAATGTLSNTATVSSLTSDPDPTNNTSTVNTGITTSADLSITKTDAPDPVIAGNTLTYTLVISNAGPSVAQTPTLADAVPVNLQNPEYSTDGGATWSAWTGNLVLGNLNAGSNTMVEIRGKVNPAATSAISNTATVTSPTPDPNPNNNTATATTAVNTSADVSIVKTDNPDPVVAGNTLTYTLVVSNAGPSVAQTVTLADTIPVVVQNPEYSTDGGVTWSTWTGNLALGSLNPGSNTTVQIRGKVNSSAAGIITNTATVSSTTPDPNPTNNTSTTTTSTGGSADLSIVKTDSPNPVIAGNTLTYTLVVANAGPSVAQVVTLTDIVPIGIQNPEYSTDGGITWSTWTGTLALGNLNSGTNTTVMIRGKVNPAATGTLSNTATVGSQTPDPDPTNNTSTTTTVINSSADVSIVKTDSPDPVIAGSTLTYTLVVTNAGPSVAQTTTLTDVVPIIVQNPEYSTDGGVTWTTWTGTLALGNLALGSTTVQIRGKVNPTATGTISNTAIVNSVTSDPDPTNNTSTATTLVSTSADVSVVKTDNPSSVVAGNTLTYTIVVTNAGPSLAQTVTLTDAVPVSVQNPEYSTDGGATWSAWTGNLPLGNLGVGSTTVQIRGIVSSSASGTITNTATVASPTPDPNPNNNTSTTVTQVGGSADISVVKTDSPDPVIAGNTLTYTIVVANAGPSVAQTVTLTDVIPASIPNPEYSTDGGTTWSTWTGTLVLGNLNVGSNRTVQIRGRVSSSATGTVSNTATVASPTPDPNPANNTSTATTTVNVSADLSIVKTDNPDPVIAGNTLTYTLVVANAGPSVAQTATLTDTVPVGFQNPEYSTDGGATWTTWTGTLGLGNLAVGNLMVLIRGKVNLAATGTLSNTATVSSPTLDPDPTNNTSTATTQINESADISIVKTDNPDPVVAGSTLTYTLVVANAGPSTAQAVTLTDTVPASIQNPEYSTDGGTTWNTWTGTLGLGALGIGNQTILIRGKVSPSATGTITNTATVSSLTPDPDPTNNTSTTTTSTGGLADVSVVKTDSPDPVIAGNTITYTIVVTNAGPSVAGLVTLTDTVPANVQNPQYSTDGGVTWTAWTGTLALGDLVIGSTTIQVRGIVSPSATGTLSNTATVISATPDPNPNNNTSTITTQINALADVSVVKTDSPDPVIAGNTLTYSIVVANAGPSVAQTVTLTDAVPAGVQSPQYSTDGGATWSAWTGILVLGNLAMGNTTIQIRGIVAPATIGTLSNTATVTSPTSDPNPNNNTSTATTQVQSSADVSIVKTDNPDPVTAGSTLTYTLVGANAGPSIAQTVTITDTMPGDVQNPEYSTDGGLTWSAWIGSLIIGTLLPNGNVTVEIRGTVTQSATGTLSNTATISTSTPDPNPNNNTSTTLTQVVASADLRINKTVNPSPVVPGQQATYTLTVTNDGPSDAQDVEIVDIVNLQNPEYSIDNGNTWSIWTGSVGVGTMGAGSTQIVLIRGKANPLITGTLSNTATVTSTTQDPDPTNNTVTIHTTVNPSADMSIIKVINSSPVIAGAQATYTLTVMNNGPSDAQNVKVIDAVNLQNPQYSLDNGSTWVSWTGSINLGTVAAGMVQNILVRGIVSSAISGSVSNTATVESTTSDPDSTNNTDTINTTVGTLADVSIAKTVNPDPVMAGKQAIYTLAVTNHGPSDAQNVTVTDTVNLQNPEYSVDGGVTWSAWTGSLSIGSVISGTTSNILVRGMVNASMTGILANTANVTTTTTDPDPTNNTVTIKTRVDTEADISINKIAMPDPLVAGEEATYEITVTNNGPADAQSVVLNDTVNLQMPEYSLDNGVTWSAWNGSVNLGVILTGTSLSVLIRGKVGGGVSGTLSNTAKATSTTSDPNPNNNTVTITTTVTALADLRITKVASPAPMIAGKEATYTLTVTNSGPADAQNVVVNDVVILDAPQYSIDSGVTWAPWTGSVNLSTIPKGATKVVLIKGNVDPSQATSVDNTAKVTSTTTDPNPGDNTVTITTIVNSLADVSITKTALPSPLVAGDKVTYTIKVTNNGPSDAQNVTVSDAVNLQTPQYSLDNGVTWLPWTGNMSLGMVPLGITLTILIQGVVSPSTMGTLSNTAMVTTTTQDPDPNNNTVTINTVVNLSADISIDKSVTPDPVIAGKQAIYTLIVTNKGLSDAQNVTVHDAVNLQNPQYSLDNGVTWVTWNGSVMLGTALAGTIQVVLIRGIVSPAAIDDLHNTAIAESTTPDPDPNNNTKTIDTTVTTSADMSITKTISPSPVIAGKGATYTLTVSNKGPSDAKNVVVKDIVSFQNPQYSLDNGITWLPWTGSVVLGTVVVAATVIILIRGTVSPSMFGKLDNTAHVTSSTPDPDPNNNSATSRTIVTTLCDLLIVKTSSPNPVKVGQLLTYTIVMSNKGPSDSQNAELIDQVPSGFENPEYSTDGGGSWLPWVGSLNLGVLGAGTSRTVLIRGTVSSSVTGNLINTATITTTTPVVDINTTTSTEETVLNKLEVLKSSQQIGALVGHIVNYSITISNKGQTLTENMVVTDLLVPELSYRNNLKLNGVPMSGDITQGVAIPNLAPGESAVLTFDAKVVMKPQNGIIPNQAVVDYSYRKDQTSPAYPDTVESNRVEIRIYNPSLSITKSADSQAVVVGKTFVYTINVTNSGDIMLNQVMLTDNLPASFEVQNITVDGIAINGDIRMGINIGDLVIGQTKEVKVTIMINQSVDIATFYNLVKGSGEVFVDPNEPPRTIEGTGEDTVGIAIYNPQIAIHKSANKKYVVLGEAVVYTITLTNIYNQKINNIPFEDIVLTDILDGALEFIPGSVTLDGVSLLGADIFTGIDMGTLQSGQTKTVDFIVKVVNDQVTQIPNIAIAEYSYQLPSGVARGGRAISVSALETGRITSTSTIVSNEVILITRRASLSVVKTADQDSIALGDTLTYTVKITNDGDVPAYNIIFKDNLSAQTTLIPGSFKINGVVTNVTDLSRGVAMPNLAPGESTVITYQVKVIGKNCKNSIENQAEVDFEYLVPDGVGGTKVVRDSSASVNVNLQITQFKQMSVESYLAIPETKPDIESINSVIGTAEISSCYVIETSQGVSEEGQQLTGHKLSVVGEIRLTVEYTALNKTHSSHAVAYSIPFNTFIILPPDYRKDSAIDTAGMIENIYFKVVDLRNFFVNSTILINGNTVCCC